MVQNPHTDNRIERTPRQTASPLSFVRGVRVGIDTLYILTPTLPKAQIKRLRDANEGRVRYHTRPEKVAWQYPRIIMLDQPTPAVLYLLGAIFKRYAISRLDVFADLLTGNVQETAELRDFLSFRTVQPHSRKGASRLFFGAAGSVTFYARAYAKKSEGDDKEGTPARAVTIYARETITRIEVRLLNAAGCQYHGATDVFKLRPGLLDLKRIVAKAIDLHRPDPIKIKRSLAREARRVLKERRHAMSPRRLRRGPPVKIDHAEALVAKLIMLKAQKALRVDPNHARAFWDGILFGDPGVFGTPSTVDQLASLPASTLRSIGLGRCLVERKTRALHKLIRSAAP